MNATPQGAFYRFLTDSLTPNCLFKPYALSKVYSVQQPGILVSGTKACAPGAHGSAAGHEDAKLPEHGESKQLPAQPCHHQPAMGAARAPVPAPDISCHLKEAPTALCFTQEAHF